MARRQNQDDAFNAFFSGRGSGWVSPSTAEQLDSTAKENAKTLTAEDLARQQIAGFESQGIELTDDQRAAIYNAAYKGEDYNLKEGADFSNVVPNKADTVPDAGPKLSLESLAALPGNVYDYGKAKVTGANAQQEADAAQRIAAGKGALSAVGDSVRSLESAVLPSAGKNQIADQMMNVTAPAVLMDSIAGLADFGNKLNNQLDTIAADEGGSTNIALVTGAFHRLAEGKPILPSTQEMEASAARRRAAAIPVVNTEADKAKTVGATLPSGVREVTDVGSSFISQPEQVYPTAGAIVGGVLGGPVGAKAGAAIASIPIAGAMYDSSFADAVNNLKLDPELAGQYAGVVAAIQAASEGVGGPAEASILKLAESTGLKKLTKEGAKDWILQKAKSRLGSAAATAGRIAAAGGIEGLEGVAGRAGQEVFENSLENNSDLSPEARQALHVRNADNAKNRLENYWDEFRTNAEGGVLMGAPVAAVGGVQEQRQITADRKNRANAINAGLANSLLEEANRNAQTRAAEEQRAQEARDAAAAAREKKPRVRPVETIAGTLLESVPSTGTRGPASKEAPTGVPAGERAEELKPFDVARKRIKEETGATPTKAMFGAMRAALKANPNATAEEIHAAAKKKVVSKSNKSQTENELDNLSGKLGLGMAAPEDASAEQRRAVGAHNKKVKAIVSTLVNTPTQQSSDLQSLAAQGRMVIAPNSHSIGRTSANETRQAEYDPETGKMYLYTDHISDPNKLKSILPQALHESVHGGTRSDNESRGAIYQTLLGKDGVSDAAGKLRVAARNKNSLAVRALDDARADTANRAKRGEKNPNRYENEELVAYFASHAAKAREGVLGTVGGVVKDIRTKARNTMRDKLGFKLDYDLGDLDTAAQGVAGEFARSDVKKAKGGATLAMIYNKNSKGFDEAVKNGYVYDSVDGRQKYVLSDADAKLTPGAKVKLRDTGSEVKLSDVMQHDVLYKEHPEAKNIPVRVVGDDALAPGTFALYDAEDSSIWVSKDAVNGNDPNQTGLKEALMHEIQHFVQDKGGYLDDEVYTENPDLTKVKNNFAKLNKGLDTAARKMLDTVPAAVSSQLDRMGKQELTDLVYDRDMKDYVKASSISSLLSEQEIEPEGKAGEDLAAYRAARVARNEAMNEYNSAHNQAHNDYLSNITEREAFRTQYDRNLPEKAVRERGNPEPQMREQSSASHPRTAGRIDVPDKSYQERYQEAAGQSLGMAADGQATGKNNPVVYRETNANQAVNLLEGLTRDTRGLANDPRNFIFAATDPSLALGQGDNKGIMMEIDPSGFDIEQDNSKPASGFLASQEQAELKLYKKPGSNPAESVKSITLKPGWKKTAGGEGYAARLLLRLKQQGWQAEPNDDGTVTYTRPQSQSLGMAAEQGEEDNARWTPAWFTSLFRNDHGLGKEINAIVEHARTSAADDRMRSEALLGKYEDALGDLAKERGVDPAILDKELGDALDAIDDQTDSYDENLAKYIEVASRYGEAGQALIDLRNQVDDQTMDILRQRAAQGGKLTKAELKRYQTLRNNMGRYVHRLYAAYQGKAGKKYAKKVMDAYWKKKAGKELTPAQEENYQLVADAVRELVDNSLMIPSDAQLAETGVVQLRRLYDTWATGNSKGMAQDELREKLADMRDAVNGDRDRLGRVAEEITEELLGLADETSPITRYFRGSKLDTGILQERSKIPAALRAVMGEVTTPAVRLMATVGKQAEFIARNKMLLEMRKFVGTDLQPPEAVGAKVVVNNKMKKLEGESWGPLEGWFASPNLRSMLGDVIQHNATFEQAAAMASAKPDQLFNNTVVKVFNTWAKVAGASKMLQVVGKLTMFPVNFAGAFRMLMSNGNVNPANILKGWSTAAQVIAYAINPKIATPAARLVSKYGVTDSAMIGELKTMDYRQIQALVNEMANKKPAGRAKAFLSGARKIGISFKETYAMMDVWSKISNFYHQVDVLKDFYEKNGTTKTDDEIYREAADNVNRTNITYKRAAPIIKVIERGGITQFGTYFYETFRSEVGNIAQGISEIQKAKDATTPEARNVMLRMASQRLIGQAMSWAAVAAVSRFLAKMAFGDDRDKEDKLRKLLPDFARSQDFLPVGLDKNGKPVLANISMFDPIGPVTDFLRQALNGDGNAKDMWEQFKQLYVEPRIVPQLAKAITTTFGNDRPTKDPVLQQLFPEGYENVLKVTGVDAFKDKTVKAWLNVGETFLPGTLNSWRDTNPHPVADSPAAIAWSTMSYAGMYMYQLSPASVSKDAGYAYKDTLKDGRKSLADFAIDRPNATFEETVAALADVRKDEKEAWQKGRDAYLGMQAAGMKDAEIKQMLKDGGIPATAISSMSKGQFKSNVLSKDSINGFMGNEMKGKSRKEKEEIKAKWQTVWTMLSGADKAGEQ